MTDRREALGGATTLDGLQRAVPGAFTSELAPSTKGHAYARLATSLRLTLDYWRYLEPVYDASPALRARAATQVPPLAVTVGHSAFMRRPWGRRLVYGAVDALERAVPGAAHATAILERTRPDVLVVTPLLYFGSPQVDYVRAAKRLGIPTVLCVGSWDHLTTKGLVHEVPDAVTVWNEAQRDEAAELHGIPKDIVTVTGSPAYDHWFEARPSLSRDAFAARIGLPADREIILYVCSSPFIAPREVRFVKRWLQAIRESADPRLREIAVLVRPHPQNADQWRDVQWDELGPVAIFPRLGANPVDEHSRADYYHSMYFSSAVVGVNTSALIESGIVGRPVYSPRTAEFAGTQEGTLHFRHLQHVSGGLLTIAADLPSHVAQLQQLVDTPIAARRTDRAFIQSFIRPLGLDRAVAPALADVIERVGSRRTSPARTRALSVLLRPVAAALAPLAAAARSMPARTVTRDKDDGPPARRRLLVVLGSPEYLRFYDDTLAELGARGHDVAVTVNAIRERKQARFRPDDVRGRFVGVFPERRDAWAGLAHAVRGTMDFVRYLDPRMGDVPALRARVRRKALPRVLHWLDRFHHLPPALVRELLRALTTIERAIPVDRRIMRYLAEAQADAVVVSPLVDVASEQVDVVRAARAVRLPVIACIASWDNLTNKGLLRVEPDLVTVWNGFQKAEASDLHGVSADRIVVTGAQAFDRWFERRPSRSREEFCAMVGLDPSKPFVLFTGSSFFIAGETSEAPFVRRWIEALRSSDDSAVRDAGVLVRPHPYNADQWAAADVSDLSNVAIWPRGRHDPTDEQNRDAFFDSIYYSAAVVGINTSAMIEATIIGRPVHSLMLGDFDQTQQGTIHFRYLLPEHGGFLQLARSMEEHVAKLSESIRHPEAAAAVLDRFVSAFIRPHGRLQPAVPLLADAIVMGAEREPMPHTTGIVALALRAALAIPVGAAWTAGAATRRLTGGSMKQLRKQWRLALHHRRKRLAGVLKEVRRKLGVKQVSKAWRRACRAAGSERTSPRG
ncbi:MAG: hypothetical protein AB1635_00950 [Acidobacteriota bacterium]